MAHELVPRAGIRLTAFEAARRLQDTFHHVVINETEGRAKATERADWIERAKPAVFLGHQEVALAHARRLKALAPGEALTITFGDTPNHVLQIVVLPDEPILFGYRGPEDEIAYRELVDRCARALECDVVLV